ncbi:MAG: response regulator [Rhodothermales bacterium]
MIQDIRPRRYDGVRVLVAEDSSINQRLSKLLLEMIGCRVTCVSTGFQAVEAFGANEFDLVLMDFKMPGIDGFEATEMIRNIEHAQGSRRRVPIIGVTAFALPSDRSYSIRRGMDDCLIKPLRKELLVDMLTRWLNIQSLSA